MAVEAEGLLRSALAGARLRASALLGWGLFVSMLGFALRGLDLATQVPGYGDALEVLGVTSWLAKAHAEGLDPMHFPYLFAPTGWNLGTYSAGGLIVSYALVPLYRVAGPALAYNLALIAIFAVSYSGAQRLALRFLRPFAAAIAGVLYAFCGMQLISAGLGHLNVLLATALLPWFIWALDSARVTPGPSWRWSVAAGTVWGLMIWATPYFVWIGGVSLGIWQFVRRIDHRIETRAMLLETALTSACALLVCAPSLWTLLRATNSVGAQGFGLEEVNRWGASLNTLFLPRSDHPLVGEAVRLLDDGGSGELGGMKLGLVASVVALAAMVAAWRSPHWRPLLAIGAVGLLLSVGLTLRWSGETIRSPLAGLAGSAVWRLGHLVKPAVFPGSVPPAALQAAVPGPALLLSAMMPYFEQGRVLARYLILANLVVALLAPLAIERTRRVWLKVLLTVLLILETLPTPFEAAASPPGTHPAFEWVRQQPNDGAVLDVYTEGPFLQLLVGGEALAAVEQHWHSSAAGAGSVWPAHMAALRDWLWTHPDPIMRADFATMMRFYDIKHLLLHQRHGETPDILSAVDANPDLRLVRCFPAPTSPGPWPYSICVAELRPSGTPALNLLLDEGWSGAESWGVWAQGDVARASWVASTPSGQRLSFAIFPNCIPSRLQRMRLEVNGRPVAEHAWMDCDQWTADIPLPDGLVRRGLNTLAVYSAYAATPVDASGNPLPDTRRLAAGFSRLAIEPLP